MIQDDASGDVLNTVVLVLFTSDLDETPFIRPRFKPTDGNGLHETSDLMVDIIITARREQVGKVVGRLSLEDMARAERALLIFLGFAA